MQQKLGKAARTRIIMEPNRSFRRLFPSVLRSEHQEQSKIITQIDTLHRIPQEEQWAILKGGITESKELIKKRKVHTLSFLDDTVVGGPHSIFVIVDPFNYRVFVEIPSPPDPNILQKRPLKPATLNKPESEYRFSIGGKIPSIIHSLEGVTRAFQSAEMELEDVTQGRRSHLAHLLPAVPFPELNFYHAETGLRDTLLRWYRNPVEIPLNLTVVPTLENAIVTHHQARHLNPETILRGYYLALQKNLELVYGEPGVITEFFRHTMFVQRKREHKVDDPQAENSSISSQDQKQTQTLTPYTPDLERYGPIILPNHKDEIIVVVLPDEEAKARYSLQNLDRLAWRFEGNIDIKENGRRSHAPPFTPKVEVEGNKTVIHLHVPEWG